MYILLSSSYILIPLSCTGINDTGFIHLYRHNIEVSQVWRYDIANYGAKIRIMVILMSGLRIKFTLWFSIGIKNSIKIWQPRMEFPFGVRPNEMHRFKFGIQICHLLQEPELVLLWQSSENHRKN